MSRVTVGHEMFQHDDHSMSNWPYRYKAKMHGASLPWEGLEWALGLRLHN